MQVDAVCCNCNIVFMSFATDYKQNFIKIATKEVTTNPKKISNFKIKKRKNHTILCLKRYNIVYIYTLNIQ